LDVVVVHACKPTYSGSGGRKEGSCLKASWAKLTRPCLKNNNIKSTSQQTKMTGGMVSDGRAIDLASFRMLAESPVPSKI
jgi:hypothetical protein